MEVWNTLHRVPRLRELGPVHRCFSSSLRVSTITRSGTDERCSSSQVSPNYTTRRASSQPPSASWTNRTVNTPPRGRSSFPPVRETPSSSTTTRPFFDLSFAETTDNESNAPSFCGGAGSSFCPGDAKDAQPQARVPRQTSPAQTSTTPVIQEVIALEQDGTVPPAAPPTTTIPPPK